MKHSPNSAPSPFAQLAETVELRLRVPTHEQAQDLAKLLKHTFSDAPATISIRYGKQQGYVVSVQLNTSNVQIYFESFVHQVSSLRLLFELQLSQQQSTESLYSRTLPPIARKSSDQNRLYQDLDDQTPSPHGDTIYADLSKFLLLCKPPLPTLFEQLPLMSLHIIDKQLLLSEGQLLHRFPFTPLQTAIYTMIALSPDPIRLARDTFDQYYPIFRTLYAHFASPKHFKKFEHSLSNSDPKHQWEKKVHKVVSEINAQLRKHNWSIAPILLPFLEIQKRGQYGEKRYLIDLPETGRKPIMTYYQLLNRSLL